MNIAPTGSLGNIGHSLAERLLYHGHAVAIISSNLWKPGVILPKGWSGFIR